MDFDSPAVESYLSYLQTLTFEQGRKTPREIGFDVLVTRARQLYLCAIDRRWSNANCRVKMVQDAEQRLEVFSDDDLRVVWVAYHLWFLRDSKDDFALFYEAKKRYFAEKITGDANAADKADEFIHAMDQKYPETKRQ